jgi:hypothetical protein
VEITTKKTPIIDLIWRAIIKHGENITLDQCRAFMHEQAPDANSWDARFYSVRKCAAWMRQAIREHAPVEVIKQHLKEKQSGWSQEAYEHFVALEKPAERNGTVPAKTPLAPKKPVAVAPVPAPVAERMKAPLPSTKTVVSLDTYREFVGLVKKHGLDTVLVIYDALDKVDAGAVERMAEVYRETTQ